MAEQAVFPPQFSSPIRLLADKGYDADQRVIERLKCQSKAAVIPPKHHRKTPRDYDLIFDFG